MTTELTNCPDCSAPLLKRPNGYWCKNCGLRINIIHYEPNVQNEVRKVDEC